MYKAAVGFACNVELDYLIFCFFWIIIDDNDDDGIVLKVREVNSVLRTMILHSKMACEGFCGVSVVAEEHQNARVVGWALRWQEKNLYAE